MSRFIIFAFFFAAAAATLPSLFDPGRQASIMAKLTPADPPAAATPAPQDTQAHYLGTSAVSIPAGPGGHFEGHFRINGRAVDGLVDTGATYVAMNARTAQRLGVNPPASAYVVAVRTANGTGQAARITLDSVEIGGIRVFHVEALVLPDAAISDLLIGMTFLSKLRSYGVRDGMLALAG